MYKRDSGKTQGSSQTKQRKETSSPTLRSLIPLRLSASLHPERIRGCHRIGDTAARRPAQGSARLLPRHAAVLLAPPPPQPPTLTPRRPRPQPPGEKAAAWGPDGGGSWGCSGRRAGAAASPPPAPPRARLTRLLRPRSLRCDAPLPGVRSPGRGRCGDRDRCREPGPGHGETGEGSGVPTQGGRTSQHLPLQALAGLLSIRNVVPRRELKTVCPLWSPQIGSG
ncbi:uncharacterized protein [Equus przewalskii]|uniref:Uncharacterized protein n=1 Tax=Equus przewalskii TaxID=9798 RepID=A0ABM4NKN5_EQUPR